MLTIIQKRKQLSENSFIFISK